jgi:isoleucyl-tRNA synthetase
VIPETPAEWRNPDEAARWAKVQLVLDVVTAALEIERKEKRIGNALEASPDVLFTDHRPGLAGEGLLAAFDGLCPEEIFRTSTASVGVWPVAMNPEASNLEANYFNLPQVAGVWVRINLADHPKCARSWRRVADVGSDPAYPDLSARDADAVRWWDAKQA